MRAQNRVIPLYIASTLRHMQRWKTITATGIASSSLDASQQPQGDPQPVCPAICTPIGNPVECMASGQAEIGAGRTGDIEWKAVLDRTVRTTLGNVLDTVINKPRQIECHKARARAPRWPPSATPADRTAEKNSPISLRARLIHRHEPPAKLYGIYRLGHIHRSTTQQALACPALPSWPSCGQRIHRSACENRRTRNGPFPTGSLLSIRNGSKSASST